MPVPHFLFRRAEHALNALLKRDPATPSRLRQLAGYSMKLSLGEPAWSLLLIATSTGLQLDTCKRTVIPDACVTLPAETLGALLGGTSFEQLALEGRLKMEGELHVLTNFRQLLTHLDPNVEGLLSQLLGTLPAHTLVMALRQQHVFRRETLASLRTSGSDYLTEEGRWVVGERQIHVVRDLLDDIQHLLNRCEMRATHLEHRTAPSVMPHVLSHDNKEPLA